MNNQEIIEVLKPFISQSRIDNFNRVLSNRTNYVSVVLENVYQRQNTSAVLRTCDCFGVQNVHVIEDQYDFEVDPEVAMGASKWLNIHQQALDENSQPTISKLRDLKADGYRIVATTPHTNDVNLEDFDLSKGKFALVFGTEKSGISQEVFDEADEFLKVPMYGFTESFNISVCAAITLHHLTLKLRESDLNWKLSEEEFLEVQKEWMMRSIKSADMILNRHQNDNK